jgi:hypothetical protein
LLPGLLAVLLWLLLLLLWLLLEQLWRRWCRRSSPPLLLLLPLPLLAPV